DEKRKAAVEAKNQADAVIHSTEKALSEHGDKVSEADRNAIQGALDDLKGSLESDDAEAIAAKTQTLIQASMKLGEAMYAAQQGSGDEQPAASGADDDVVDADFEEVDNDD
ncbi:Hsp70 family protein, partial [Acinetobacter baumannii]|uniref:Hsp70 family protein n=1 Tax=Acinetobacter baumannii TaxID=470 RepID=UPI003329DF44